jgi:hypothetical protein
MPLNPTATPYDAQIERLKERREDAGRGLTKRLGKQIRSKRAKQYLHREENRPAEEIPLDPLYEGEMNVAAKQRQDVKTSTHYGRQELKGEYGFEDDPGVNPFSRAALLQRAFQTAKRQSQAQFGQRGQLHSGAYQRQLGGDELEYARREHDLQSLYRGQQRLLTEQEAAADIAYGDREIKALAAAHKRAQEIPVKDAPAPPPMVKKFTAQQHKRYLTLKGAGKSEKAAKLKEELQSLGAWKPAKIKKLRKKRKKGKK